MARRSGYIQIDVSEFLHEATDEDILAEVKSRKLVIASEGTTVLSGDLCEDAYQRLLRGDAAEALLCLERALYPKWRSEELCRAAYQQARLYGPSATP